MVTQVLAATTAEGTSTDVTIAAGSTNTIAIFTAEDDVLALPDGHPGGVLLLPDGTSRLLLPLQYGDSLEIDEVCEIRIKDPNGQYGPTGWYLRSHEPVKTLGPGIYQVVKPETTRAVGIQSE